MNNVVGGILLVILAGLTVGSCLWPMKVIKRLQFEHYWFIGMLPLVLFPWMVVATSIEAPWQAVAEVGWRPLLVANLLAIGWGVANILGGVCVMRIGLALTGAIMAGCGVTLAVSIPMIFKGSGLFQGAPDLVSRPGLIVLAGVVLMLAGVSCSAIAGFGRERFQEALRRRQDPSLGSFLGGLTMAVVAGILSAGPSLAFVYGNGPIVAAMRNHGAGETAASFCVWAVGFLGGALLNVLYPAWRITRGRSWSALAQHWGEAILAFVIGSQLILGFGMQGIGMVALGALGASVGAGIQQAMQLVGAQGVGFLSGEWQGVFGRPRQFMYAAITLLLIAALMIGLANTVS